MQTNKHEKGLKKNNERDVVKEKLEESIGSLYGLKRFMMRMLGRNVGNLMISTIKEVGKIIKK